MHRQKPNIRHTLLFAALAAVAPVQAVEIIITADKLNQQNPPQYALQHRGHILGHFADLNILQPRNSDERATLLLFEAAIEPQLATWLAPKKGPLQAVVSDNWLRWQHGDAPAWRGIGLQQLADCGNGFFQPEIDDEVLILFTRGDIRQPIVIGALYNDNGGAAPNRKRWNQRKSSKPIPRRSRGRGQAAISLGQGLKGISGLPSGKMTSPRPLKCLLD